MRIIFNYQMCVTVLFSAKEIDTCLEDFSSLAGSLVKWFKYADVAETSCVSLMIETSFISETLVYLNHLLQLSTRDFIEIDIVCHFCNRYYVTSEIDIVCHF
jgi:hypothetical protein